MCWSRIYFHITCSLHSVKRLDVHVLINELQKWNWNTILLLPVMLVWKVPSYLFCESTCLLIGSANAHAFLLVLPTHVPSHWFCQRIRLIGSANTCLIGSANARAFLLVLRTHVPSYLFCERTRFLIGSANARAFLLLVSRTHAPSYWFCQRTYLLVGSANARAFLLGFWTCLLDAVFSFMLTFWENRFCYTAKKDLFQQQDFEWQLQFVSPL